MGLAREGTGRLRAAGEVCVQIDVWSDVVCPWCYIGKRRLEQALERYPGRDGVVVRYHSFQLDPSAPAGSSERVMDSLARKYRVSPEQAEAMMVNVTQVAADEDLAFQLADTKVENTLDAHRLLHHAGTVGKQADLKERLMAAHFCNGERIGTREGLLACAADVGLDLAEAAAVIDDPSRHRADVAADITAAQRMGIRGVPFFVINQKFAVSGAQPEDTLLAALMRATA